MRPARALVLLGLAIAPAGAADEAGRLWIGVEGASPPFHFVGADRKLSGMEVEIAEETCRRMGKVCVFRITGWEDLKPALIDGRVDLVASSLEIPRRSGGKIAYSVPVYTIPWAYVVHRDAHDAAKAGPKAPGVRIAIENEGPAAGYLARRLPGATVVEFGARADALLELAAGRVQFVLMRRDHAVAWMNATPEGRCCRVLANVEPDVALTGRGVAIALRSTDGDLKASVDKALGQMREDGTLSEIVGRWQLFPMQ